VHFPLTIPLPWVRARRVITLHDVLHRDLPQLVSRSTRAFRLVGYDQASRSADLVIVPTEFVRERAVATLGLDRGRVRVVAHGVDHDLFRPGGEAREPFLLYPARFWPHKNHEALFEAFASVRRERPDLELVLTGGGHDGRALPTGVRSVGHVPETELARLYRTAELMVFPSLYEGFGAPLVEAMASGCAVAASNAGSLPEVAGDAAALFDPSSGASIASGIFEALAARDVLVARGLERARRFTWEAAATAHESAYKELLPSNGRC
jgi:glycosyltransferase involved in cell wall biosynthesis